MEKIIKTTDKKLYFPNYLDSDETFCFLDIETDGLSSYSNNIILVGIYLFKGSDQKIIQLFAEKKSDERDILKYTLNYLMGIDTIFTYNGSTFDIPFIKTKIKKYKLNFDFSNLNHIDLISIVRKNKTFLDLENCKLKTVEKRLGIEREDTINGKESIILYEQYLETLNPAYKKTILKHNFDDIYYLPNLLYIEKLLDCPSLYNTIFESKYLKFSIDIKKSKIKNNTLILSGSIFKPAKRDLIVYEDIYNLFLEKDSNSYKLTLYLSSSNGLDFIELSDVNFNIPNISSNSELDNIFLIAKNNILDTNNLYTFLKHLFKNL